MANVMLNVLGLVQRALTDVDEGTSDSREVRAAVLRTSADNLRELLDSCTALRDSLITVQGQATTLSSRDEYLSVQTHLRTLREIFGAYYRIRGSCITLRTELNEGRSRDLTTEELQSYTTDVDLHRALLVHLPELFLPDGELSKNAEALCETNTAKEFEWPRLKAFSALLQRLENTRIELLRIGPELRAKAALIEDGLVRRREGDA